MSLFFFSTSGPISKRVRKIPLMNNFLVYYLQGWQSIDCPGKPGWENLVFPGCAILPEMAILGNKRILFYHGIHEICMHYCVVRDSKSKK